MLFFYQQKRTFAFLIETTKGNMKLRKNTPLCLTAWKVLAAAAALTSCHGDYTFDPDTTLEVQKIVYDYNFREKFGDIDPEQNWGFDDMEAIVTGDSLPTTKAMTRAANPNSNQWGDFTVVPGDVTNEEARFVYEYFNNLPAYAETGLTLRWTDFFVQQVWEGKEAYTDGNGHTIKDVSKKMNKLVVGENNEHVYNFNNGHGYMMLMQNSSTSTFGYHNTEDSKYHYEHLIVYVPQYDAYYVGFDFFADGQNPNQQVARDGKYTDWIVKVVPAMYHGTQRIMCEDLGDTDDFDFNDVVFDVSYQVSKSSESGTFAKLMLVAAGGTMPIELSCNGQRICEVHEAFGVPTTTMVNTHTDVVRPMVQYVLKLSDKTLGYTFNPDDITVTVLNTEKGISYTLSANSGSAPYKICVPTTVAFTAERENIELKYPKFRDWVNDSSQKFWE